uniref:protein fantom n=1 Tax=Ciona intestinalis TaxID=7719 RepID=UPI000180C183|nr:protein fantom [Ciona intestinalis]|eukprot:XP_018666898.1 protein fantom [Ciona intestinalis]
MSSKQETQRRAMVAKIPREDLEDQHLRIQDENEILKTHARKQEEKIKKMATKLIRLVNDRKKQVQKASQGQRSVKDVELEETIENQQDAIRKLNKDNEMLKQKLMVASQQIQSQGKRHTPYNHVNSRVNTGVSRKPNGTPDKRARSAASTRSTSPHQARYGHSLLEEARGVNQQLEHQILALQEQVVIMERENQHLKQEITSLNTSHEEDILKLREMMNSTQKKTLGENVELIKVHRAMKDKSNDLTSLEARYHELQQNCHQMRQSYEKVLQEMERLKSQLLEEQNSSISLQNQLKHGSSHQRTITHLQEQIRELTNEVNILKEANDKLTHSAFGSDKEQQWRQLERKLRVQIAQLEAAIKSDVADKNNVLEKMANEQGFASRLHNESRKIHEEATRLRRENEELRERVRLYTASDDSVDIVELREALAIVRQKRHTAAQKQRPDFLENVDDDNKDPEMELGELQAQYNETIHELDKTREMLLMQHKINKDYQLEVESVSNQMESMKREYETKLDRFARLLDARAARIKKLESQLHDVAYGTKQFKFQPEKDDIEVGEELDETIQLERGENLFEINITKATLSKEALIVLDDRDPSMFVTFAFYDYELVSTPILKSASPQFDFTAQYTVKVDDTFLHHLQKDRMLLELHHAMGVDHKTVATCKVRFHDLLDKPQGKLHGSVALTGLNGGSYGTLDFWIRLRVPMDQAIRLYRERTKALGYLSANSAVTKKSLEDLDEEMKIVDDNINQLLIQIISCNHVLSRRDGIQPNIYCVYKFFDFADHDTSIIPCTNNPHFDDRQAYPVQMNMDIDAYLKSEKLTIYVFDDTDPEISSYLGKAVVDLIPLAHGKVIKAPFQLTRSDGSENGTLEVSLRWQLAYKSPSVIVKSETSPEDEEEIQEAQKLVAKPPVTPKKRLQSAKPLRGILPQTTSTPKPLKAANRNNSSLPPVVKKVSIVEPEKEKPVPLSRSMRGKIEEEKEEEGKTSDEDQIEEIMEEVEEIVGEEVAPPASPSHLVKDETDEVEDEILDDPDDDSMDSNIPTKDDSITFVKEVVEDENEEEEQKDEVEEQLPSVKEDSEDEIDEDIMSIPDATEDPPASDEGVDMDDTESNKEDEEEQSPLDETEDVEEITTIPTTDGAQNCDTIRISVNHLTLDNDTSIWGDTSVEQLFVEYEFLGEVEETPNAVKKPTTKDSKLFYKFAKETKVDKASHSTQRETLTNMLQSGQTTFRLTVVSEPVNDNGEECEEIGSASVDLASILQNGRDIINGDVTVHDLRNKDETVGMLNLDVEALAVLRVIKNELKERAKMHDH